LRPGTGSRVATYRRATGHKVDLEKALLGSAEFFAECDKIAAMAAAMMAKAPKPGTLGGPIAVYKAEEHFQELSRVSKREYNMCADILYPIQDIAVSSIDAPTVNGAWSYEEAQTVLGAASPHLRAAQVMIYCTDDLDPPDALGLLRDQMDDDAIRKARDKTQEGAAVPVNSILADELARAPDHDALTILASPKGTPWTYEGFSSGRHRLKRKLENARTIGTGLTPKGLRHTMATWLREAGTDKRDISDLPARKSKAMGLHYSKDASLARKNKQTMAVWEEENERRSKVVKPFKKTVKPWEAFIVKMENPRYFEEFNWCPGAESNHRHEDFQSTALPLSYPGRERNWPLGGGVLSRGGHGVQRTTEKISRLVAQA